MKKIFIVFNFVLRFVLELLRYLLFKGKFFEMEEIFWEIVVINKKKYLEEFLYNLCVDGKV